MPYQQLSLTASGQIRDSWEESPDQVMCIGGPSALACAKAEGGQHSMGACGGPKALGDSGVGLFGSACVLGTQGGQVALREQVFAVEGILCSKRLGVCPCAAAFRFTHCD